MAASKITTVIATATALLAFTVAASRTRQLAHAKAEAVTLQSESDALSTRLTALETALAAARKRAAEAEADTEKLLAAAETASQLTVVDSSAPPVTKVLVDARYKRAKELAQMGRSQEALTEFLWCYDKGMPVISSFTGVRSSFLLSEIEKLGKHFPAAAEALRTRRDQAIERMTANPDDRDAAHDFASLSSYLGEKGKVLEFYDQLPATDPRRPNLLIRVYDQLIEARRYADAATARPFSKCSAS